MLFVSCPQIAQIFADDLMGRFKARFEGGLIMRNAWRASFFDRESDESGEFFLVS
jgi:hypothetical protein